MARVLTIKVECKDLEQVKKGFSNPGGYIKRW
jgi:hypothetical protein